MVPSVSCLFDFLQQQQAFSLDRHEVESPPFGALRRSIRAILKHFRSVSDLEAIEISDRLRAKLSEWLTVPVEFNADVRNALVEILGDSRDLVRRWGKETGEDYVAALKYADLLSREPCLMRETLGMEMLELREKKQVFKIYCHKRARCHFETILTNLNEPTLGDSDFLHSVTDYGNVVPFDVLIKVGPLRTSGWGKAPSALLTAPRFRRLIQVVWTGCADEDGFDYDPTAVFEGTASRGQVPASGSLPWKRSVNAVSPSGHDPAAIPSYDADADELRVFQFVHQPRDRRRAIFLQFDDTRGILFPIHSEILSHDPSDPGQKAVRFRMAGEAFQEGMFFIQRYGPSVDFGDIRRNVSRHEIIWKNELAEQYRKAPNHLRMKLRREGLDLQHLHACIRHWCMPTKSVIHAPQKAEHFRVLVFALGIEAKHGPEWWKGAWDEIRHSRGEAIQYGLQEHEIIEEQELFILSELLQGIRESALSKNAFRMLIPDGRDLKGTFEFNRVVSVEEGFLVPDEGLKIVHDPFTVDQWRA